MTAVEFDHWQVMRDEASGAEGSFMLTLSQYRWDKDLFARMERAMRAVCAEVADSPTLDRWLVGGFWYITDSVPDVTSHPAFHRPDADYYARAVERLSDLAYWFFHGESIHLPGYDYETF